jgi:enoyl-CoA hydratase
LEWLVTGKILTPQEAAACGLANRVVRQGEALAEALTLAQGIALQPAAAVQAAKALLRGGGMLPAEAAAALEQALFPPLWAAEEHLLAVEKFLRRREGA